MALGHAATSLWLAMAGLVTLPVLADGAADLAAIRVQIEALRAEQAAATEQQKRIDTALGVLEAKLRAATPALVARPAPAASPTVASAAPAPRLAVSGDLRVRAQGDYPDSSGASRNSAQLRGRLGAKFAVSDRITLGARIATGDGDDPNSTDVQLSNFDDDLQVSLDLAYIQLNFSDLQLYAGKIPQPFARTELVWDGDVNPQGLSATWRHPVGGGFLRANGLFFLVDEQVAGKDSTMWGEQLGYDSPAMGNWKLDVSAAWYDYRLHSVGGGDVGDFRGNLRNADGSYRSDFNLANLVVGASWSGLGARWPVRLVGDYVKNLGAATDADTGYGIDLAFGRVSATGDWRVTLGRSMTETDSVLAAFSHDNIGIATNYRLDSLTFDYVPFPRATLGAVLYHYQPYHSIDAGALPPHDSLDRLRLYFVVNF